MKPFIVFLSAIIMSAVNCQNSFANDQTSIVERVSKSLSEDLEFSGFARVVGGSYDQSNAVARGYDNSFDFGNDSLLAVRADYAFNNKVSIVGQAILHSNENRKTGIQWLYLDYRPTRDLTLKLGRQRIPLFQYSDVIDVGFAYPWITPPISVYANYLFTEFDGAHLRYNLNNDYFNAHVEAYAGEYEGNITLFSQDIYADVNDIGGAIFEMSKGKLSMRFSHHFGHADVQQSDLVAFSGLLAQLGFQESAESLLIDDKVKIYQIGFDYEDFGYFLRGEYTDTSTDAFLVNTRRSAYLSVGINDYPFTYHATMAYGNSDIDEPPNELMFGLSPELDALAGAYQLILTEIPPDQGHQYTLGVRYDMLTNLALKAEITYIRGSVGTRGFVDEANPSSSAQRGRLFQLAAEWVF